MYELRVQSGFMSVSHRAPSVSAELMETTETSARSNAALY